MIDLGQLALLSVFPLGALVVGFAAIYLASHSDRRERREAAAHRPAE
jgi:hypothetical protein